MRVWVGYWMAVAARWVDGNCWGGSLNSVGWARWVRLCGDVLNVEGFFFFFFSFSNDHGLGHREVVGFHNVLWATVGRFVMVGNGCL
jgi:hypothetical protein